ncbi:drug/metabolite transporter, DME family/O-acetylserine/cysteine efflux transporter [Colwellia chukchiensis]|uniref:Drug/metabolite transporter, DME family/O-acetylserine/cysteine efflux transporter n=1 Tax=Colwellia chukchiensis TaxID=641665 RepID=A0A1H7S4B3_9GAMM|nr:EamA family transporter [Colwellia chukchiensis]SEL67452.1 drug/metabolite transporter, DME family/O-acetylserine/cysteine efflux transporter [Colwellia chukchiensis]
MSLKDSLLGLIIIFIWGFNFVIIAWGVQSMPPLLMGGLRFLLVAILGSFFIRMPNIPWRWMALYAFTLCFGQFSLLFSALAFGMPAGLASLVLQSQAVFTLLFSLVILKEQIKRSQMLAMLIAGLGLYLIASATHVSSMTILGFSLTVAAAIAWGLGNVVNRMINQRGYQANIGLVVWSSWFAMLPFFLTSYLVEGQQAIMTSLTNLNGLSVVVLFYLAIAASIIAYSLWSYLLMRYPAGQVAPLTLGAPIVGIVAATLLLDERMTTQQIIGGAIVASGLVINTFGSQLYQLCQRKVKA